MIKKILLTLMLALPMAAMAQGKFAVVNIQQAVEAMPSYQKMQQDLQDAQKKYQEEGKKLQDELQAKAQEFDKLAPDTPEGIKQRRQEELQTLYQRLQEYQYTVSQDLERQQQTLSAPIMKEVMDAVNQIGTDGNYVFIFDSSIGSIPLFVSQTQVDDVTDKLKAMLLKK